MKHCVKCYFCQNSLVACSTLKRQYWSFSKTFTDLLYVAAVRISLNGHKPFVAGRGLIKFILFIM
jgi:hypothetical protein